MADSLLEELSGDEPLLLIEEPLSDRLITYEGNQLRTENASASDWERHNVLERTSGQIHTRVELLEVTHGTYDEDGDEATLMVFRFRFDPQKQSRRVIRARVDITFRGKQGNAEPIVDAIAPDERWSVVPTTDSVTTTNGAELNLGASGVPFLSAGGSAKFEKTTSRDISNSTTVSGARKMRKGQNSGEYCMATWIMQENNRRKSGVPDSVTAAVLLRREDSEPFDAIVELEADVDWASGIEYKFLRVPLDDPILFNPRATQKKHNKGRSHGVENLASIDLYELCKVRFAVEAPFVAK
ncbi:hypothetical protein FGRMN_2367 [Fusarium graminum]|nr:hypothetical protein FGRMN_2367 [Fusarium graminum]